MAICVYDLQVRYFSKQKDYISYAQIEKLTDVEGLDVGLSLTGLSVGVLEGWEMKYKEQTWVGWSEAGESRYVKG